jgi:hypothetical protein
VAGASVVVVVVGAAVVVVVGLAVVVVVGLAVVVVGLAVVVVVVDSVVVDEVVVVSGPFEPLVATSAMPPLSATRRSASVSVAAASVSAVARSPAAEGLVVTSVVPLLADRIRAPEDSG